jgi:hypothetical protein
MAGANAHGNPMDVETVCMEHECAWWIDGVYTTENIFDRQGRCAMKFIAEKNSEGKLPV